MADPRTVTIGNGKDQPDLATALANETYKTLTSDNGNGGPGILIYDCYNLASGLAETPAAEITVTGYGCDANNYLIIRAAASELTSNNRFKYSTDRYRIEPATNVSGLVIASGYVRLIGIQVRLTIQNNTGGNRYCFSLNAGSVRAERCIAKGNILSAGNTGNYYGFSAPSAGATGAFCINCIAYDLQDSGKSESRGHAFIAGPTGHHLTCYNCTAVDNYRNYWYTDGQIRCYNCGSAYGANGWYSADHCSSSNPTFKDRANDDYHLGTADTVWKGQGADQSGVLTDDIDGDTRGGAWDIGFDQATIPRNPVPMGFIVQ